MPALSILVPHKHTRWNDAALHVALDCLIDNTQCDYELLMDSTTPAGVYGIYNRLARQASAEWIVFFNSDTFVAPGWDVALLAKASTTRITTPILVECGVMGVNTRNVQKNFGMTPQTFRRAEFETWAEKTDLQPFSEGWYMPSLWSKKTFLTLGGFDTSQGDFPYPCDGHLHEKAAGMGIMAQQVRSFCYHLQEFSNEARTGAARVHG